MSIRLLASVALAMGLAVAPQLASATLKLGPLQISGSLQSQNLFQTPEAGEFNYVMNRNTANIQLQYEWLQGGKFYNRYDIPFIENSKLFLLYRGVYDGVYGFTPGFVQKDDIHGKVYGRTGPNPRDGGLNYYDYATQVGGLQRSNLTVAGLPNKNRTAIAFENTLREAYVDVKFRGVPLTMRAGRQQIVWGETDNFRMLDRANSLDLSWHLQQELPGPAYGWDAIRRPFWMFKFLYDMGDIWKLSQNFLEWYYNPGDWYPAKQSFLPRPWGLPLYDPLTNNVDGAFLGGPCNNATTRANSPVAIGPNAGLGACTQLMNNTRFFVQGDYARNPIENSQVGVRYHGIAPFGMEFTLNYFYQRWAGDDGTNYAQLKGLPTNPKNDAISQNLLNQGIFPAMFIAPYVHTFGASANYSDETFTQTVYRFETILDFGIPFYDAAKTTVVDGLLPGVTNKNMWKGMIAFDRPTWIRWLNKKSTVFLTGQWFWHYLMDNPGGACQAVAQLPVEERNKVGSCLVGGLDLPSSVRLKTVAFRDKIRTWESIFTLAAFTFYRGGSIVPTVGIAVDPVNQFNMEPFWNVNYVVRDDFVIDLGQHYFITPRGRSTPVFETWGLGGFNAGRSETILRVTFQF
jgi:hypothetical protein